MFDLRTVADGQADAAPALQDIIDAGGPIVMPPGKFRLSRPLRDLSGILTCGAGRWKSDIRPDPGVPAFLLHSRDGGTYRDFSISYATPERNSASITLDSPLEDCEGASFQNLGFRNHNIGLNFLSASGWVVDNCRFLDTTNAHICIQNRFNADWGDNTITNSLLMQVTLVDNPYTAGIKWISSGGLRIVNNKINLMPHAIQIVPGPDVVTSDFIIANNSIEAWPNRVANTVGILVADGKISQVQILGNQVSYFWKNLWYNPGVIGRFIVDSNNIFS